MILFIVSLCLFDSNYLQMIEHNERYVQGGELYQKGLNKFSATRVKDVLGRVTWKFPNALPERGWLIRNDVITIEQTLADGAIDRLCNWPTK